MKSKVYFINVKDSSDFKTVGEKLKKLLEISRVLDFVKKNDSVAVKIHFGEEGNTGHVDPRYVRVICDKILASGAKAFLSDTNTLYLGKRTNSKDHLETALRHGYCRENTGVDVIIPDDTKPENTIDVEINQKNIKTAKLARLFVEADDIVAINHFKGHIMTGFGGALKNIAMGCAIRVGKMMQHCEAAPVFYKDQCVGCGACEKVCPVHAIVIVENKASLDKSKCIGCASCIGVCPTMAMFIDMEASALVQDKMVEYVYAVLKSKQGRAGFINFAVKITRECDCWGSDNPIIAPDVAILASSDPVSIDKASFDMVVKACGKDVFKEQHPAVDGMRHLKYAHKLGLGNLDYELVEC